MSIEGRTRIKSESNGSRTITSKRKRTGRTAAILITVGLLVFFVFAAFYDGLVVCRYKINTEKLSPGQSIRVVLVTDLHSYVYGDNQKDIVSLIRRQEPDIIALAGDIADNIVPIEGTELFLANINGIAPVYYVTGNHEFWSHDIENIKRTVRKYGVTILEHNYERLSINGTLITVCGVDDPDIIMFEDDFHWEREMQAAFDELEDEPGYKLLLSHRPERIDTYRKFDFDLVLSGHAHGGQVRIPLILNGLYAPDQGWFPKYAGGLYEHGGLAHVVSRGVSYNPKLPRIFNPPEVTVIDIIGKTE